MHRTALSFLFLAVGWPALLADSGEYVTRVKPLLRARCYACHGALRQEAGLRLDTVRSILRGGESGPAVIAGEADSSLLIAKISASDIGERMPPEGPALTPSQLASLRAWIEVGAPAPEDDAPEADPRNHWAFQAPERRSPPKTSSPAHNAIDAFVGAQHEAQGLQPLAVAEKRQLLRRLYVDLLGFVPTRAEVEAFLADVRVDAYAREVDRLLAMPQHGERWARHWMDIWRYTDWYGLGAQSRNSQKHIWHWRDWIIESLNGDKGYDRMVLEMLAADEIAPDDLDSLRATGFLARNYYLFNRDTWLDSTIEHTSRAFLALTVQCARCHDHKYDPLAQTDYYRLRAIFEPHQIRLDQLPGETDLERNGLPRAFDAHLDAPTYLFVRGDAKQPAPTPLAPGVPASLSFASFDVEEVALPLTAHRPALRGYVLDDALRQAEDEIQAAKDALDEATRAVEQARRIAEAPQWDAGPLWLRGFDLASASAATSSGSTATAARARNEPAAWTAHDGEWLHDGGRLRQTRLGARRAFLRSSTQHPRDLYVRVRFRTLGGERWKSVGVAFDVVDGREKQVYLSAVTPGSKLQYAYELDGKHHFPERGRRSRPVELDREYELCFVAKGSLLNVTLDGELLLAYEMSTPRERGRLDLVAFDAEVDFLEFEARALPSGVVLAAESEANAPTAPVAAQRALDVAAKRWHAAKLRPAVVRAAWQADRARAFEPSAASTSERVRVAVYHAREYDVAVAEETLLRAEDAAGAADGKGRADAEKKLEGARRQLETSQRRLRAARADLDKIAEAVDSAAVDSAAVDSAAVEPKAEGAAGSYASLRASLKALEGPDESEASRRRPYPERSSGRRRAFARWIVDRRNPLSARVVVNHIWLRHFGEALVPTVADFGRRAPAPALQGVLDGLAVECVENGWSMKDIHRRIVTSRTYQLSGVTAGAPSENLRVDPENRHYWHRPAVRMEAEVLRDSLLRLNDSLNLRIGGPTVDPKKPDRSYRRSLYFTRSRDDVHPVLTMFDEANILECYRRSSTVIPQQALTMANSELALRSARQLAARLSREVTSDSPLEFVRLAFETVLCTSPHRDEERACLEMLEETTALLMQRGQNDPHGRARANLVHALLNHNDFITVR